jgi:xanthine dehydrogenase YagT iron-sulfur-binding subunit
MDPQRSEVMPVPFSRREFLQSGSVAVYALAATGEAAAAAAESTSAATRARVRIKVNGTVHAADLESRVTLLDYLHDRLALTGTRKGCNEGACGTCTVLIDGKRMNACLTLAAQCDGREVRTVEGLAQGDNLHPVQQAFIDHDAFQCGYCTSGQLVSAVACIEEGHAGSEAEVHEWMSGNLCRCSCYPQITAAVLDAAQRVKSFRTEGQA